ncbi:MAG: isochorismatase family protein [Gemmatimonas sp.]
MTTRAMPWDGVIPEDELEIYNSFFKRKHAPHVGDAPALLAIDLYEKVFYGGAVPVAEANRKHPGACGVNAHNAVPVTQKLFAAARTARIPVIYTTGNMSNRVTATNRVRGAEETGDGYRIFQAYTPRPDELVIYKERASAFYGTPLEAHLQKMRVRSLIVCGDSTSGCVRASVVDAYSRGFHVTVVEECVFDRSRISHAVSLFDLHHKYADVMPAAEVLAHLDRTARLHNAPAAE